MTTPGPRQASSNGRAAARSGLRRAGERAKDGSGCGPGERAKESDGWRGKLGAHRRRQASVAAIIDRLFGGLGQCNPDLWERRAYLLLVGLVYERLATDDEEISTDELVRLAKALAENRRIEARRRDGKEREQPAEADSPPKGDLPERFGDIVRQVYGTNFQTPSAR